MIKKSEIIESWGVEEAVPHLPNRERNDIVQARRKHSELSKTTKDMNSPEMKRLLEKSKDGLRIYSGKEFSELTQADIDEVISLANQRKSIPEIYEITRIGVGVIRGLVKKHANLILNTKIDYQAIKDYLINNKIYSFNTKKMEMLKEQFGVSKSTLYASLKETNEERKSGK